MKWIEECFQKAIRKSFETGEDWCVTLTAESDSDLWVQITADSINLAYPFSCSPEEFLTEFPSYPGQKVVCHEEALYLTLSYQQSDKTTAAAIFVEAYMKDALKVCPEFDFWSIQEESLS